MVTLIKDLHKDHPLVKAAHKMVIEHEENDTMFPALEAVVMNSRISNPNTL
jgi:hypothetical protein